MNVRAFMLVAAAVLGGLAVLWFGPALGGSQPDASALQVINGLGVETAALDLGEFWLKPENVVPLTIYNRREVPAAIVGFGTSSRVAHVEPRSLTIAARGSASVKVKLDLAPETTVEVRQAARAFQVQIRPVLASGESTEVGSWLLQGVVRSPVTFEASAVDFGVIPAGDSTPIQRIWAEVHVPQADLEAHAVPNHVAVELNPSESAVNLYNVDLAPRQGLRTGVFSSRVHFSAILPNGSRMPRPSLRVTGAVASEGAPPQWTRTAASQSSNSSAIFQVP
jgi:hypothetical protein